MSPVERDQIVGLDLDCGDQDRHVRLVGDQIAPCGDFRGGWILDDSYMAGALRADVLSFSAMTCAETVIVMMPASLSCNRARAAPTAEITPAKKH